MKEQHLKLPNETIKKMNKVIMPKGISMPKDFLDEIKDTLKQARVFISSREKMHPTGILLYDQLLDQLEEFYPKEY